jgi:hypothetical protein
MVDEAAVTNGERIRALEILKLVAQTFRIEPDAVARLVTDGTIGGTTLEPSQGP